MKIFYLLLSLLVAFLQGFSFLAVLFGCAFTSGNSMCAIGKVGLLITLLLAIYHTMKVYDSTKTEEPLEKKNLLTAIFVILLIVSLGMIDLVFTHIIF